MAKARETYAWKIVETTRVNCPRTYLPIGVRVPIVAAKAAAATGGRRWIDEAGWTAVEDPAAAEATSAVPPKKAR